MKLQALNVRAGQKTILIGYRLCKFSSFISLHDLVDENFHKRLWSYFALS